MGLITWTRGMKFLGTSITSFEVAIPGIEAYLRFWVKFSVICRWRHDLWNALMF